MGLTEKIVQSMDAVVPQPPEAVWAVVTDLDRWQWRSDLKGLERTGLDTFTEYDQSGFATRFTVTCRREPVEWAFDLENANMAGQWTGQFQAVPEGTKVTFTESLTPKKWWMKLLVKGYLQKQQMRYFADLRQALTDSGKK